MLKKYEFRLDPVLKLRKLKEETCRTELGQLIGALGRIEAQLQLDRNDVETYFKIQEGSLKTGIRGDQLQAFPMLVAAKERNIELLLQDQKKQESRIEQKRTELATLRGELKVIEKLKEKGYDEHKKAMNKEIDQKVEEQTQIWSQHKDKRL
ncbi:MAG TPA: flagellar export protein FliJ [Bacteriovoracaceae bacterium]|nr:flagellar export protein FliJ [Bacteriovoracaceae bacterium]